MNLSRKSNLGFTHQNFLEKISGGFTLIELLVVVAIIGVLAAVVLAALSGAKSQGSDAAVKAQLGGMKSQSELYTNTGATAFVGTCATTAGTLFETANNGLGNLFKGIALANTYCYSVAGLPSSGSAWAVAAKLSTGYWCIDSSGASRAKTTGGVLYTAVSGASPAAIATLGSLCQ